MISAQAVVKPDELSFCIKYAIFDKRKKLLKTQGQAFLELSAHLIELSLGSGQYIHILKCVAGKYYNIALCSAGLCWSKLVSLA